MTTSSAADPEPDLYRALGGMDACRRLATAFYRRVARDPDLRALFPSTFDRAIESLALFLAQFLGGPAHYSDRRWWLSLRESHLRFPIRPSERDAWARRLVHADAPPARLRPGAARRPRAAGARAGGPPGSSAG